jgi:hypothetical protein
MQHHMLGHDSVKNLIPGMKKKIAGGKKTKDQSAQH